MSDMGSRSWPTTAGGARLTLSAYPASASATTEADLFAGIPFVRTLPCACGGSVTADIECPAAGIREHQATSMHREWRLWGEL